MPVNSGSNSQGHPPSGRTSPDDLLQSDNEDSGVDPISNHHADNDIFAADPLAEQPQEPSVHTRLYQLPIADVHPEYLSSHDISVVRVSACPIYSPRTARLVLS